MISRREFINSSVTLAMGHTLQASGLMGQRASAPAGPPRDLLSNTFPESFLRSNLAALGKWRPYPNASERGIWKQVPEDVASALVHEAENDLKRPWSASMASTFLQYKREGNRSQYESESFGRRSKLLRLVLAECIQNRGRFIDQITNGVWLICEESFWGVPAHLGAQKAGVGLPDITEPIVELFGADTAQLLAWTKYLLGERLDQVSPLIGRRIVAETQRRILEPARTRNDFGWMGFRSDGPISRLNNWNPWINSNLMVANLILEENAEQRILETTRILKSLDQYLNQYWPDAGEEEGPGYFSASPMCYFDAVNMIQSATGDMTPVFTNPFIREMGRYILAAHIAGEDYVNFGDAHVHPAPDGDLLYRFGKAVNDSELEDFGAFCAGNSGLASSGPKSTDELHSQLVSMSRALPAVLQVTEVRQAKREDILLRDSYYPELGLVTARVKGGSPDGMYFADLAANNGRSHSHNDTGSYIIYLDGQPVVIDLGTEAYTAKTFSPDRYTIWTMQSAFHNLPTIGGQMQQNGVEYKATNRSYESNDSQATYSFDIAHAYPAAAGVKSWIRKISLDRIRDVISVEEQFEINSPVPVVLSLMTQRVPTAETGGILRFVLPSGPGRDCLLKFDADRLEEKTEMIRLTDSGLRRSWGEHVYRILLSSKQPLSRGAWSYSFRASEK